MLESKKGARIQEVLKKADGFVSITYVADESNVSWAFAKMALLQLLAEGKIEGQEIDRRGWIFRAKNQEILIPAK